MPWIAICYRHGDEEYKRTGEALDRALSVYQRGLHEGVDTYLDGPSVKPVFRRYN
jgi:glutamate-1-semialdehyde 2,1-aminomutase